MFNVTNSPLISLATGVKLIVMTTELTGACELARPVNENDVTAPPQV
jgi:hypothetical protein